MTQWCLPVVKLVDIRYPCQNYGELLNSEFCRPKFVVGISTASLLTVTATWDWYLFINIHLAIPFGSHSANIQLPPLQCSGMQIVCEQTTLGCQSATVCDCVHNALMYVVRLALFRYLDGFPRDVTSLLSSVFTFPCALGCLLVNPLTKWSLSIRIIAFEMSIITV